MIHARTRDGTTADARPAARSGLLGALLAVLPILGAAVVFWPALRGGLVSDDYLLQVFVERGAAFAVDWSEVLADFGRPWLGLESAFWRPLLSVSFALDLELGGGSRFALHLTNWLLHLGVTAGAVLLGRLVAPGHRALGGLVAGSFVAVHPVAVEPVAWLAARNSELEVFLRTAALAAFALHLRPAGGGSAPAPDAPVPGRSGWLVASLVLAALALASKESAVLLPVSLLGLDLVLRPGAPLRARLARQATFAPLWIAYAAWRFALFGAFVGAGGSDRPLTPGLLAERFAAKMHAVFAPLDAAAVSASWLQVLPWGIVVALALVHARRILWVALPWIALHAAPTFALDVHPLLGGSRMVYGLLPIAGLLAAAVIGRVRHRAVRGLAGVAFVGLALACGHAARERLGAYVAQWRALAAAETAIAGLLDATPPDRPIAVVAMPPDTAGLPPTNPNAWFPLFERPVQDRDAALVSLGFLTVPVPGSEPLLGDASAFRACREAQAPIVAFRGVEPEVIDGERLPAGGLPPLSPAEPPGHFTFAAPVPADAVEWLAIRAEGGTVAGGRVEWLCGVDLPPELAGLDFGTAGGAAPRATFAVDLSHALALVTLETLGIPLSGFRVVLDGGAVPGEVRAHARVPELRLGALATRLDGRERTFTAFAAGLVAPAAPPPGVAMRLVLAGPATAFPVPVTPGAPVELPDAVLGHLAAIARFARSGRYLYWFETIAPPGEPGFARSLPDTVELAPDDAVRRRR